LYDSQKVSLKYLPSQAVVGLQEIKGFDKSETREAISIFLQFIGKLTQ
jgi:hypothetical protein